MATPGTPLPDILHPGGKVREELLTEEARTALRETLRLTRATRWESIRSPHIFMGLLAAPDGGVLAWGEQLRADLPRLLAQFQELFLQEEGDPNCRVYLHREFLSDNVIRLLRDSLQRAREQHRDVVAPLDLLVCLLTSANSIVAEYFDRIGLASSRLAELALLAEQNGPAARPPADPFS